MFDINQVEPILSVDCHEPVTTIDGRVKEIITINRKVRPLTFDMETLFHFWKEARKFKYLFAQEINDDFGAFCSLFLANGPMGQYEGKGIFYLIDDWIGILYMTDISYPSEATVHYTFFDRRQNGRVPLIKEMLKHVFLKYGFNRLNASLPLYATPAFPFVKAIGFKDEGRKRQCRLYKGVYFDEALFGILKSEVL